MRLDPAEICTLPSPELAARRAWIREAILPHALSREVGHESLAFELREVPGLEASLERLVALERKCCGGIEFAVTRSGVDRLRLELLGVDPDAALLD